ncbi:MAG: hypothetical protein GC161_12015 [Planctomycetaceae bacterium]|nr:hypothetical protein [Planctomycetaceae bacterium]
MQHHNSPIPKRRVSRVVVFVAALTVLAIVGAYAVWRSGAPDRWAELDREWASVVAGAQPLLEGDRVRCAELARLLGRAEALGLDAEAERLVGLGHGAALDPHTLDPRTLDPELLAVLEAIERELEAGRVCMDEPGGEQGVTSLLASLRLLAHSAAMDGDRLRILLGYARRLQREGGLSAAAVGTMLARGLLDRIDADPTLLAELLKVDPPRPEELYASLLREHVRMTAALDPELGGAPPVTPSAELDRQGLALRRAVLADAERYRALAGDPARFGTAPTPAQPGFIALAYMQLFPGDVMLDAALLPMLAVDLGPQGAAFAELIERWQRLVEKR